MGLNSDGANDLMTIEELESAVRARYPHAIIKRIAATRAVGGIHSRPRYLMYAEDGRDAKKLAEGDTREKAWRNAYATIVAD